MAITSAREFDFARDINTSPPSNGFIPPPPDELCYYGEDHDTNNDDSSLPWLTSDYEKLSSSSILACKVDTTIEVLCLGIPSEITPMLIYSCNLAFSEDPDYDYLQSLLHGVYATVPATATCSLDFGQSNDLIIHSPPIPKDHPVAKEVPRC
ncbi:hypothetical protein C8R48DRAFT_767445 [Suillus tomentosus]|nr:hypothetical protein C8R48DRAFT_767445 [Suillus tomentosus]